MATSHSGMIDLSGKQNMLLDVLALAYLPWFAAIHFDFISSNIQAFGGYDLAGSLWTVGGIEISVSLLAIIGGFAWIVGTNQIDGATYSNEVLAALGFGLFTPVLFVFVPAFADLVTMNGLTKLFFTSYVTIAATYVGYSN